MSTPIVAGNGAMARQYFREGWYNTGSKNLTLGFEPSAALLKAVLINSATAMSFAGVNPDASSLDVTLTDPPDDHQVRRCKLAWLGLAWLGLAWLGLAWLGSGWVGLGWSGWGGLR